MTITRKDPERLGGFEHRLLEALTDLDSERVAVPAPAVVRPRRRRVGAFVVAGAAAAAVLGAAAAVAAFIPSGATFATSENAVIGGPMFVKGSGCGPAARVSVTLDGKDEIGSTTADGEGLFYASLTLPLGTAPGRHTVVVRCAGHGGTVTQRAPLNALVTAPVQAPMLDVSGPGSGSLFYAKGTGCQPGADVAITLGTVPAVRATATAGPDGTFVAALSGPATIPPGTYPAVATCTGRDGHDLTLRATVTVERPSPEPTVTKPTG